MLIWTIIVFLPLQIIAQSTSLSPGSEAERLFQRYALRTALRNNALFTDVRPIERSSLFALIRIADTIELNFSQTDRSNLSWLKSENLPYATENMNDSRNPVLRHFYKSKANLFQVNENDFNLFINPGLYLAAAYSKENDDPLYTNTRTIEIRGDIGGEIGFYSFISENQIRPVVHEAGFIKEYGSYPGAHLTKTFKTNGIDFFQARGYVTFSPIRQMSIRFGQDRNFIGHGIRSLLLSDFATDYLFLRVNTRVWRFNYVNLFSRLTDRYGYITGSNQERPYPAKYQALHYLSIKILKNLDIGLFETVIFHDNENKGRGFDVHYLNPVIFYRSVEHQLGDPDKMMVGLNLGYIPLKDMKLYGQFMLNEFRINDLRAGNGHAANKFGYQAGLKYIDVAGISNLDLQLEYNRVRPYSYTHYAISGNYPVNSYTHYNHPLAHPLGANFSEWIFTAFTQPLPKLTGGLYLVHAIYGADTAGSNWGGNIFLDYRDFEQEYGNKVGQGVRTELIIAEAWVSYQLRHNLFVDLEVRYRRKSNATEGVLSNNLYLGTALRLNLARRNWQF